MIRDLICVNLCKETVGDPAGMLRLNVRNIQVYQRLQNGSTARTRIIMAGGTFYDVIETAAEVDVLIFNSNK